jgi:hypothetical protein
MFKTENENKKSNIHTEIEDPGLVARSDQAIYIENRQKDNNLFSSSLLKKVSSLGWIILCGG